MNNVFQKVSKVTCCLLGVVVLRTPAIFTKHSTNTNNHAVWFSIFMTHANSFISHEHHNCHCTEHSAFSPNVSIHHLSMGRFMSERQVSLITVLFRNPVSS